MILDLKKVAEGSSVTRGLKSGKTVARGSFLDAGYGKKKRKNKKLHGQKLKMNRHEYRTVDKNVPRIFNSLQLLFDFLKIQFSLTLKLFRAICLHMG